MKILVRIHVNENPSAYIVSVQLYKARWDAD
uniref:Uncharacterized protein n=1 Tax=Arundo donax TaxID=35708 RepID=A0A0A9BPC8_ARUDO